MLIIAVSLAELAKSEAINLMQDADFTEKYGTLQSIKELLSYIKMGKEILTSGDIEIEKINLTQ